MGAATVWVGIAYDSMPATTGWQLRLLAWLQHNGQMATDALSWIPNWAAAATLALAAALLGWRAFQQLRPLSHRHDVDSSALLAGIQTGDDRESS